MLEEVEAIFKVYKSFILWLVGLSILISVSLWFMRANHVEDARIVYEEYQEIYNTCQKLSTDLCNMNSIPENDKMFEQFSKAQRILAIKTQLNTMQSQKCSVDNSGSQETSLINQQSLR